MVGFGDGLRKVAEDHTLKVLPGECCSVRTAMGRDLLIVFVDIVRGLVDQDLTA